MLSILPARLNLALATIAAVLLLTLTAASGAAQAGYSAQADSDRRVPVVRVCYGLEGNNVGLYSWRLYSNEYVEGVIYLDRCKMRDLGFGKRDRIAVLRHERAHSLGWSHYEGHPSRNAAYYPSITPTGR